MNIYFLNTLYIILIILGLNLLQYAYYFVLNKTKDLNFVLKIIIGTIIRFGVIIHELCHLFFAFLGGNKIIKIEFLNENGGKVITQTKNYIGSLGENGFNPRFIFWLILNQIGIFLTSFGPLIFGVISCYLFFSYFGVTDFNNINKIYGNYYFYLYLSIYSIFIPSFALSIQDIKNFFLSKQEGPFSTFVGSMINFSIFIGFILLVGSFIFYYLIFFSIVFFILFLFNIIIYILFFLLNKLFRKIGL